MTKTLTDYCMALLIEGPSIQSSKNLLLFRDFENIKESLHDLLIQVSRHPLSQEKTMAIENQLHLMSECEYLYTHTLSLREHLERGLLVDAYSLPSHMRQACQDFQKESNEQWLAILLNKDPSDGRVHMDTILDYMTQFYFSSLLQEQKITQGELSWLYEIIGHLRHMDILLKNLCQANSAFKSI